MGNSDTPQPSPLEAVAPTRRELTPSTPRPAPNPPLFSPNHPLRWQSHFRVSAWPHRGHPCSWSPSSHITPALPARCRVPPVPWPVPCAEPLPASASLHFQPPPPPFLPDPVPGTSSQLRRAAGTSTPVRGVISCASRGQWHTGAQGGLTKAPSPNEDDTSVGAGWEQAAAGAQGHGYLPRPDSFHITKSSQTRVGRASLHPRAAPEPSKAAQGKPSVSGRQHRARGNQQRLGTSPSASTLGPQRSGHPRGPSSGSSRLSLAPWWWEGAGKHTGAARTTSLNQHQTSAGAPAVTSQRLQFGTLLCTEFPVIPSFSYPLSPGPKQTAQHRDWPQQSQQAPRSAQAPSRQELHTLLEHPP